MDNDKQKIELLAPAKDLDTGIAAINCGADAVYVGAPQFSAREKAGNSIENIEKLVNYAHQYYARVYITLNTILNDSELLQAVQLVHNLYNIGVDAIIIQDMGFLEHNLPPIPLFASTQTHNISAEKISFLHKVGFQRVILGRELSLEEIKNIHSITDIELECFVHGAVCVSYSGQCYMSYAIGGRSGNRGQCAQPCRKKYSLRDSTGQILVNNSHLLSLKDMNRSNHLRELVDSGITSFKIEGRLKDKQYVMNIVSFYRNELDKILHQIGKEKSSSGISHPDFRAHPDKTFNRQYSDYFLNGRTKSLANFSTPKSMGEKIGTVKGITKEYFTLKEKHDLDKGDGICFIDSSGDLCGTTINKIDGEKVFPQKISELAQNLTIYRNYNHEFATQLGKSRTIRKISTTLYCEINEKNIIFKARDEDNNQVSLTFKNNFETAKNQQGVLDTIRKQFLKSGNTIFETTIEITATPPYPFIPVKILNDMRRSLLEELLKTRMESYSQHIRITKTMPVDYPEKNLSYRANIFNEKAKAFYKNHGVQNIEPAAETGLLLNGKKVMTTKYCLRYELGLCGQKLNEPLYLVDEKGQPFELSFDCKKCEMNIYFGDKNDS